MLQLLFEPLATEDIVKRDVRMFVLNFLFSKNITKTERKQTVGNLKEKIKALKLVLCKNPV